MHALAFGERASGLCRHLSIFDTALRVDECDGDITLKRPGVRAVRIWSLILDTRRSHKSEFELHS
jgi:hypothetical protein